jgi:hypothetical protein
MVARSASSTKEVRLKPILAVLALFAALVFSACAVWKPQADIAALPTSGSAYNAAVSVANASWPAPNISDQDNKTDSYVCTAAIVAQRTGNDALKQKVIGTLVAVQGTEAGSRALAIGRNLAGYVCAADAIQYSDAKFTQWVSNIRDFATTGGPTSLRDCANVRPNNWGTHCRKSMVAADLYLNDTADLGHQINLFAGWLGDYDVYHGFDYGDTSWQCDPSRPVGINPPCTKSGVNLDGVLPDDQRRAGSFTTGAIPHENYVREAFEPALQEAMMLRQTGGYTPECWANKALLRADQFLARIGFPATGDDTNEPWEVNYLYGVSPSTPLGSTSLGKGMSNVDWTHGTYTAKDCIANEPGTT